MVEVMEGTSVGVVCASYSKVSGCFFCLFCLYHICGISWDKVGYVVYDGVY